ncbi:MAG: LPS assembly lipoprotein LptE [Desulfovibrio sp.]|jgi:hypothetical protein|nr:LPS assembly lipoprotein LptE [Desulfovibrio sp.]
MWSPTDFRGGTRPRRSRSRQATRAGIRCPASLMPLCFSFFFSVMLAACAGYQLGNEGSSVLGDGKKTLKIKGVDFPTLQPWLPYAIRSRLRDEVNARRLARWVDNGSADYEMQINVLFFTTRQWIRSELDTSLLYDSDLTIEAIIYDGSTNKEIWRSGKLSYAEQLEKSEDRAVAEDIITQTVRMLADRMRNTF